MAENYTVFYGVILLVGQCISSTVNFRYNKVGYNELSGYNEVECDVAYWMV